MLARKGGKYRTDDGSHRKVLLPVIAQKLPRVKGRIRNRPSSRDFIWRRHLKSHPSKRLQQLDRKIQLERQKLEQEHWIKTHANRPKVGFSQKQLKLLRKWFDVIDVDGSGEISTDELEDPLLSIGAASNREEVIRMICEVDVDGSGSIEFAEFVAILTPSAEESALASQFKESFEKLKEKMQAQDSGELTVNTQISAERRRFLVDAIISNFDSRAQNKQTELLEREKEATLTKKTRLALNLRKKRVKLYTNHVSKQNRLSALETVICRSLREDRATFLHGNTQTRPRRAALLPAITNDQAASVKPKSDMSMQDIQQERMKRLSQKSEARQHVSLGKAMTFTQSTQQSDTTLEFKLVKRLSEVRL